MAPVFGLVKSGYGSVTEIMEWDLETFFAAQNYQNFITDYENEFIALNKETP